MRNVVVGWKDANGDRKKRLPQADELGGRESGKLAQPLVGPEMSRAEDCRDARAGRSDSTHEAVQAIIADLVNGGPDSA